MKVKVGDCFKSGLSEYTAEVIGFGAKDEEGVQARSADKVFLKESRLGTIIFFDLEDLDSLVKKNLLIPLKNKVISEKEAA